MNQEDSSDASRRSPERHASQLFMLRIWLAQLDEQRVEWRGQLQDVSSGETRYFRDSPGLVAQLKLLLADGSALDIDLAGGNPEV